MINEFHTYVHTYMQGSRRKIAFTLAEVLITLAIIGVVAAMTIPTLINTLERRTYINQFKKVYTTLSQAYLRAAQDNGTANTWASSLDTYNNMVPYLKVSQECPAKTGCFASSILSFKGGVGLSAVNSTFYKVVLSDGAYVVFSPSSHPIGTLFVDVNGDAAPNKWGTDIFVLSMTSKSGAPALTAYSQSFANQDFCSKSGDASGWIDGGSCSKWVLKNWNMDYLDRDITASEWN